MASPGSSFVIRAASAGDSARLTGLRSALFREMGQSVPPEQQARFERLTTEAFTAGLTDGSCLAWLAEAGEGVAVGSVALLLFPRLPSPEILAPLEGYLLNVFTVAGWRGKGVATGLVAAAVGKGRVLDLARIRLHTTEPGAAVYLRAGFVRRENEMELRL
jgi:GNAT superfamily N-acetyltransferase